MIAIATATDLSTVRTVHAYGGGAFRCATQVPHAASRPMPDLLIGTSGGAWIAVAKACGVLDIVAERFAAVDDAWLVDGVTGFFRPAFSTRSIWNANPLAECFEAMDPKRLACPVAVAVTVQATRQHAIVVMDRDTPADVLRTVTLASGSIAGLLPPVALPRALPGLPLGSLLRDGGHRRACALPQRAWLPAFAALDVVLPAPLHDPAGREPDSMIEALGWAWDCLWRSLADADVEFAEALSREGVAVDVYAPPVGTGGSLDATGRAMYARAAAGRAMAAAPVLRYRQEVP